MRRRYGSVQVCSDGVPDALWMDSSRLAVAVVLCGSARKCSPYERGGVVCEPSRGAQIVVGPGMCRVCPL